MEVQAKVRYLRIAPRKVRLVVDLVRGLPAERALTQLAFLSKASAEPVAKLIRSAMANAEHNYQIDPSTLYIKRITADGGPILYRYRPRAHGRAAPIRKRMTHVTVILDSKAGTASKDAAPKSEGKAEKKKAAPRGTALTAKKASPKKKTAKTS